MPSVGSLKRSAQRVRGRNELPPPLPTTLENLIIPDDDRYRTTAGGSQFLLYDSGPGNNRIIIFATEQNLRMLAQSRHWFADGTFKTAPPLFEQLYTIHGIG